LAVFLLLSQSRAIRMINDRRCDIAWLHLTNHFYHGFPSWTVKQSNA